MDFSNIHGGRWLLLLGATVVAAFLLLHRAPAPENPRGWHVLGVLGSFVSPRDRAAVFAAAPYVRRIPSQVDGMRYAGAMVHGNSQGAVAFVELLYGAPRGPFVDVAQAQSPLDAAGAQGSVVVRGHRFAVGVSELGGRRLAFASGRDGSTYLLVAASARRPHWTAILSEVLP